MLLIIAAMPLFTLSFSGTLDAAFHADTPYTLRHYVHCRVDAITLPLSLRYAFAAYAFRRYRHCH